MKPWSATAAWRMQSICALHWRLALPTCCMPARRKHKSGQNRVRGQFKRDRSALVSKCRRMSKASVLAGLHLQRSLQLSSSLPKTLCDANAKVASGVSLASQCLQRRESSALTSTSEAASAVGKSLLLDTLNLVGPDLMGFGAVQCPRTAAYASLKAAESVAGPRADATV